MVTNPVTSPGIMDAASILRPRFGSDSFSSRGKEEFVE
jgi:hypothetical protein